MAHPSRLHRRAALALSAILVAGVALVATIPVFATDDGQAQSTITGQVTGEGAGLAGITVTLDGVGEVVTGSDGGFQFSNLAAGSGYSLTTFDPATVWAAGSASGTLAEGDNSATIDISRTTLPGISGTVMSGGMPLVDILVEITGGAATPSATTSSDGAFSFNGLAAGTYSLTFRDVHDAWESKTIDGVVVDATSVDLGSVELLAAPVATPPVESSDQSLIQVVTEPGVISGVITDRASGDPIPRASVNVSQNDIVTKGVTAGDDGQFDITGLPIGTYSLTASTFGSEPGWQSQTVTVTLTESSPAVVRDIALRKNPTGAGALTGVLKDEAGNPIPNVPVYVSKLGYSSSTSLNSIQTDSSGMFRKDGLASGSYSISVGSDAYRPIPYRVSLISVDAAEPAADYGVIVLTSYPTGDGSVRGVIRDEATGAVVSGVQVSLMSESTSRALVATTNSEGVWSLDHLAYGAYQVGFAPPSGSVRYEISNPPILHISSVVRVDRVDTLRSVSAGAGSIRGVVRDIVTHLPLVGAQIYVDRTAGGFRTASLTTDSSGVFTLTALPAGEYNVVVELAGYFGESTRVMVAADQADVRVSLTAIEPEPAGIFGTAGVHGVLTDPEGVPMDGVIITASTTQGALRTPHAETDAGGRYAFDDLPAGEVLVTVWEHTSDHSYLPFSRTLVLVAGVVTTLDIGLDEAASVQGFASIDQSFGYGVDAFVSAIPEGSSLEDPVPFFSVNPGSGYYKIEGLAPGTYTLYFTQFGGTYNGTGIAPAYWRQGVANGTTIASQASRITLTAGQVLTGRNITLSAGGAISGSIAVDAPGGTSALPVGKGVVVKVNALLGNAWYELPLAQVRVNDGSYLISGLAPGSYILQFDDEWTTNRAFVRQFSGGALTFQGAQIITVTAGQTADAGQVALGLTAPTSAAGPIDLSTFNPGKLEALKGQITVASGLRSGSPATITVGEQFAGEWVSVWANSTPTALGSWTQVSNAGTVSATIPSTLSGSHSIAVQDADSQTIGWAPVTIAPASTTPSTPTGPSQPTQPGQPSQPAGPGTSGASGGSTVPVRTGATSAPPAATPPTVVATPTPTPVPSASAPAPVDEQLTTEALPAESEQRPAPLDFGWAPLLLIAVVLLTGVVMLIILRRRPI